MSTPKVAPLFPAFLDLRDAPVVVVGGGEVAERKVKSLLRCGARVTVVAPEVTGRLAKMAHEGTLAHRVKRFDESDPTERAWRWAPRTTRW